VSQDNVCRLCFEEFPSSLALSEHVCPHETKCEWCKEILKIGETYVFFDFMPMHPICAGRAEKVKGDGE
jgi:hypothetical protein